MRDSLVASTGFHVSIFWKALAVLIILIALPLEVMLHEILEGSGCSLIYRMQQSFSYQHSEPFFQFFGSLSDWILLVLSPVLMHFFDPRQGVKVVMVLCLNMFAMSLVNLIYAEPRPFWVRYDVNGYKCALGYANPDFVVSMLSTAFFYTSFQYMRDVHRTLFRCWLALGCGLVGVTCLARMYLGTTFLHQLITTLCYALLVVTLALIFDRPLAIVAYKSAFRYKEHRVHSMYWFIATLAMMLAAITVFDLITIQLFLKVEWVENANSNCYIHYDVGSDESFYPSAWVFYNLGILNGSMFTAKFLNEHWWRTPIWKRAIRSLAAVGAAVGFRFLFRTS